MTSFSCSYFLQSSTSLSDTTWITFNKMFWLDLTSSSQKFSVKLVLPNQIDFYLNWRDFKRKHGKGHYDFYVATKIFPSGVNELAGKNYDFCHSNWHFGSTNVVNTRMLMDDIAFFRYVLVILLVSFGFFWILLDMC